mgnify:CR=1 FL=1
MRSLTAPTADAAPGQDLLSRRAPPFAGQGPDRIPGLAYLPRPSRPAATRGGPRRCVALGPLRRTRRTDDLRGRHERTTYSEVAAYVAPRVGVRPTRLSEVFDDIDDTDPTTLYEAIANEWDSLFHITPEKIVAGWRDARNWFPISLPEDGWFIDIAHRDRVRALNKTLATTIGSLGISRLDISHLLGERRDLTVAVAAWCYTQVLFDGSVPHGIRYPSKHGDNATNWAVWLRKLADGHGAWTEPTKASTGSAILKTDQDPDLNWVAETMGILFL